ncbi:MAG: hypothetical protein OHK0039_20700 [Bacteroidia bacterium]
MLIPIFVYTIYAYLLLGLLFGLWFVWRGARRLDPGVADARPALRLILLPASALLWPVLLGKMLRAARTGASA